jgi:hypothetical protein
MEKLVAVALRKETDFPGGRLTYIPSSYHRNITKTTTFFVSPMTFIIKASLSKKSDYETAKGLLYGVFLDELPNNLFAEFSFNF